MTVRTARQLLMSFLAGICAGWLGGLLRTRRDALPTASAAPPWLGRQPESPVDTEVR